MSFNSNETVTAAKYVRFKLAEVQFPVSYRAMSRMHKTETLSTHPIRLALFLSGISARGKTSILEVAKVVQ